MELSTVISAITIACASLPWLVLLLRTVARRRTSTARIKKLVDNWSAEHKNSFEQLSSEVKKAQPTVCAAQGHRLPSPFTCVAVWSLLTTCAPCLAGLGA